MKNHIKIDEDIYIYDHNQYCNEGEVKCGHLDGKRSCELFDVKLGCGCNPDTSFKCLICRGSWDEADRNRKVLKKAFESKNYLKKEKIKCVYFLRTNGWVLEASSEPLEFATFNKDGCISIDISDSEMVFLGESGDFLHKPIDYYTLVGVLVLYRQLAVNFVQA